MRIIIAGNDKVIMKAWSGCFMLLISCSGKPGHNSINFKCRTSQERLNFIGIMSFMRQVESAGNWVKCSHYAYLTRLIYNQFILG